jgi:hypothetical protein
VIKRIRKYHHLCNDTELVAVLNKLFWRWRSSFIIATVDRLTPCTSISSPHLSRCPSSPFTFRWASRCYRCRRTNQLTYPRGTRGAVAITTSTKCVTACGWWEPRAKFRDNPKDFALGTAENRRHPYNTPGAVVRPQYLSPPSLPLGVRAPLVGICFPRCRGEVYF